MSSLSNWSARHGHAMVSSMGHMSRHGFATVLAIGVMALALALPLGLEVLVRNVRGATGDFSDAVGMQVYLKTQVSEQTARQLAQNLRGHAGVAEVTLITAAQGLEEFRAQFMALLRADLATTTTDEQIAALGCERMKYYSALAHEPLAANWKTVAEGLVESLHVPFVHRATFNVDPAGGGERFQSISAIDLAVRALNAVAL